VAAGLQACIVLLVAVSAAAQDSQAVVTRYCVTCHSTRLKTGGLALEGLQVAQAGQQPQTWEKVVRKVRTGMMPPANARGRTAPHSMRWRPTWKRRSIGRRRRRPTQARPPCTG
jgi:cytochrome c551/c552